MNSQLFPPYNNQNGTVLMIKLENGFAPFHWQSECIGDCLVGRLDGVDFTLKEYEYVRFYINFILDQYGEEEPPAKSLYGRRSFLRFYNSANFPMDLYKYSPNAKFVYLINRIYYEALTWARKDKFDIAIISFKKALNFIEEFLNKKDAQVLISNIVLNLANCFIQLWLFEECLNLLRKFEFNTLRYFYYRAIANANLGKIKSAQDDINFIKKTYEPEEIEIKRIHRAIVMGEVIGVNYKKYKEIQRCHDFLQNKEISKDIDSKDDYYNKPNNSDEDDEEDFRATLDSFINRNSFISYQELIRFNEKNAIIRNKGLNNELYEKCKKIYYLLAKPENAPIREIFQSIYDKYGMEILRNCYYIVYDSNTFSKGCSDIYFKAKYRLENLLEGIGGWLN